MLNSQEYDPIIGESKWLEYIKDQENILDNLVNKNTLKIQEPEWIDDNEKI